jgi:hypothetical protein
MGPKTQFAQKCGVLGVEGPGSALTHSSRWLGASGIPTTTLGYNFEAGQGYSGPAEDDALGPKTYFTVNCGVLAMRGWPS